MIVLLLDNRNKQKTHTQFWVWIVRISTAARRLAVVCLEKNNQHNGRRYIWSGSSHCEYFFPLRVHSLSRNVVGTITSTAIITVKSSVVNAGWKKGAVRRRNGWMQCMDCASPRWKGNQRRKIIGVSEIGRDINGPRIVLCDRFERIDALQTPIAATHATVEVAMPHKVSCLAKSAVRAKKQALFYSA